METTVTTTRRGLLVVVRLLGIGFVGARRDARAQTTALQESQKIEYLINVVRSLKDATFFRNGVGYDGAAAAAHLHRKWQAAGSRVTTAEEFIRLCATSSSISGLQYRIRFADGRELPSEQFLRKKLREFEALALRAAE